MSLNLTAYSDVLSLSDAKKLLAAMKKPGKGASWRNWAGEGVAVRQELKGVTAQQLREFCLPEYCCYLSIRAQSIVGEDVLAESLFLGGSDLPLSQRGVEQYFVLQAKIPECSGKMTFVVNRNTLAQFYGKEWMECVDVKLRWFPAEEPILMALAEKMAAELKLPAANEEGVLDYTKLKQEIIVTLDPERNHWLRNHLDSAVHHYIRGVEGEVALSANTDVGSRSFFIMGPENFHDEAQEFLSRVQEKNDYASYDVNYVTLEPEDWRAREKRRKKWKEPIYQKLGVVTLENGCEAEVQVRIEKEGYVLSLEFQDWEGATAFPATKLFKKTAWRSGDE